MLKHKKKEKGALLVLIIIFLSIITTMIGGILTLIIYQKKLSKTKNAKETSLYIAEAGINYYRWHLPHAENDYSDHCNATNPALSPNTDGWCVGATNICEYPNTCGPYIHEYKDSLGGTVGTFTLNITPPPFGSTVATIQSIGATTGFPNQTRTIKVRYGKKSKTKYSLISNTSVWQTGITYGPIHSNVGVHYQGTMWGLVTSYKSAFSHYAPDVTGSWSNKYGYGVHSLSEAIAPSLNPPIATLPMTATSTFRAGRKYPVNPEPFSMGDNDITKIISVATADTSCGILPDNNCVILPTADALGWHIELLGNQFKYRKVLTVSPNCSGYPTGDILTAGDWITAPWPTKGVIQVKDDTWINGNIEDKRLTLIASEDPPLAGHASIWINDSINYVTPNDGKEVMALIAQDFIRIRLNSPNLLNIDSTLFAVNKSVRREPYGTGCTSYLRNQLTLKGSIISNELYGFGWTISTSPYIQSGYPFQAITFDSNTIFNPPPHFPTEDLHTFISWEEQ